MAGDFKKVSKGEDFTPLTAMTHNAMIDAVVAHRTGGGRPRDRRPFPRITSTVSVQNVSGRQLNRNEAVWVTDSVVDPEISADAEDEFLSSMALTIDVPSATAAGRWLVLLEDLPPDEFGEACAAGVVQCKINLADVADVAVEVEPGSTIPKSGALGAEIVWVKGGVGTATATGEQWAIVALPMGGRLPTGQIQHQLYGMVTQNGAGWGLPLAVPDLTEVET